MAKVPNIQMNNGLLMPGFGLGTFEANIIYFSSFEIQNLCEAINFEFILLYGQFVVIRRSRCGGGVFNRCGVSSF